MPAANTHDVTYEFEHAVLPGLFFTERARFVTGLLQRGRGLVRDIHGRVFEQAGFTLPYTESQYEVIPAKQGDNVMILKLRMPEPDDPPLCYWVFLLFDLSFSKLMYFTLEKPGFVGSYNIGAFLCGWSAEGSHLNYGPCALDEQAAVQKCLEIYNSRT